MSFKNGFKSLLSVLDVLTNPMQIDFKKLDAEDKIRDLKTKAKNSGWGQVSADPEALYWLKKQDEQKAAWKAQKYWF